MQQQPFHHHHQHLHHQHLHHQSALEIKERLAKALDRDYNVVDMATALEVVSLLEKTAVTKEALETTRIGRLVNEMRKKTANELLAKRAKDLVRRWRDMIAENGIGTGQGPGQPLVQVNHMARLKNSASSPGLSSSVPAVATSPASAVGLASRSGLSIPPTSPCPALRVTSSSPALQLAQRNRVLQHPQPVTSPANSVASNASRGSGGSSRSPGLSFSVSMPSQSHSNSSRPSTPSSLQTVAKSKALSPGPGRPSLDPSLGATLIRSNRSSGVKRSRDDHGEETMTGFEISEKRTKGAINGGPDWHWPGDEGSRDSRDSRGSLSGDSLNPRLTNSSLSGFPRGDVGSGGTPRPLAAAASRRSAGPASKGSHADPAPSDLLKEKFASIGRVPRVKTTQELLEDLTRRSGSPTVAGRTTTPPINAQPPANNNISPRDGSSQVWHDVAKEELMAKFLRSQTPVSTSAAAAAAPVKLATPANYRDSTDDDVAEILARLPPIDAGVKVDWIQTDDGADDADTPLVRDEPSPPPQRPPVTDDDVERLHTADVDNVNGSRDFGREFRGWHETLSVSSYGGDLLHLLPYVVIE